MTRFFAMAFTFGAVIVAGLATASAACTSTASHQFDFFVGHWNVYDAKGHFLGTDDVEKRVNGCAVYERYTNPDGTVGIGLSAYQAGKGTWHQDFIDDDGLVVLLDGAKTHGAAMVMTGQDYPPGGGRRLDTGIWVVRGATVEETWMVSTDNGKTWKTQFHGFFRRKA